MVNLVQDKPINVSQLIGYVGYSTAKAHLMHLTIRCALETLRHAEERLEIEWEKFCAMDGALRAVKKKVPKINGGAASTYLPNENAITYKLGDYVDLYLKALPSDHEYRTLKFVYERPMPSKKLVGSRQKRQDLRYEAYVTGGPELVIEAKPLFSVADINKRYLGDEGLGRFTREDEAFSQDDLAAMLGYVEKGCTPHWSQQIRSASISMTGFEVIVDVEFDKTKDNSYSTRHKRENSLTPIWVLHLLLQYPEVISPAL